MDLKQIAASLLAAAALVAPGLALADCKLLLLAEFHTDPAFRVPVVDGAINGKPVKILFDTGSTFSMIPHHEADVLGLRLQSLAGMHAYDVGGMSSVYAADLKELTIGTVVKKNMELRVAGDPEVRSDISLVLGDDFFSQTDVEFDLSNNVVRLFQPHDCASPQLVYWGAAYSQAPLLPWDRDAPTAQTNASVNGTQIVATLDTGADSSALDTMLATAAGIHRPADAAPGPTVHAFGAGSQSTWIAQFGSFAVGDEKINNVRLQVLNLGNDFNYPDTGTLIQRRIEDAPRMVIGADFFHAHRVFFDVKDHLILFSYEGGPVFVPDNAVSRSN